MYVLSLHTGKRGRMTVYRSDWDEFPGPGEWVRVNARPVSGAFGSRETAAAFAKTYTAENPGHTRDPGKRFKFGPQHQRQRED